MKALQYKINTRVNNSLKGFVLGQIRIGDKGISIFLIHLRPDKFFTTE